MNDQPVRANGALRVLLSLVAIVASYAIGGWLTLDDGGVGWRYSLREALQPVGLLIVACYAASLVTGFVLHSLPEIGRRGRFGPAFIAAGLLLVYGLVVGVLAWLLAAALPDSDDLYTRSTPDPGPLYAIWLCCALLPIALAVCAGQLFPWPRPGRTPGERPWLAVFTDGRILRIAGIGWVIGALVLLVLLFALAVS